MKTPKAKHRRDVKNHGDVDPQNQAACSVGATSWTRCWDSTCPRHRPTNYAAYASRR